MARDYHEWLQDEADLHKEQSAKEHPRHAVYGGTTPHRGYMHNGVRVNLSEVDERICNDHDIPIDHTWASQELFTRAMFDMLYERRIERTLDIDSVCRTLERQSKFAERWMFNRRQQRFVGWVVGEAEQATTAADEALKTWAERLTENLGDGA